MSPGLRSASPRAKNAAISAARTLGSPDGSVGAGIAAAEAAAAAGAALATGAGFAAAVAGRGSFDSVAGSALPVGAVVIAGGGNVASEAPVDPDGMPAASTARESGSAGAGIAASGGGPIPR